MKSLKNILLLNASSSGITGLLLIAAAASFTALFNLDTILPFIGTGIFLILFSAFVLLVALRQPLNLAAVKIITSLDVLWVLASSVVVLEYHTALSTAGNLIIVAVAAWVGLMALLQYRGLGVGKNGWQPLPSLSEKGPGHSLALVAYYKGNRACDTHLGASVPVPCRSSIWSCPP